MASDYLDELIARGATHNPEFPRLFEDAKRRREQLRRLAQLRGATGLSQTQVAARMNTSQPVVARIESGEVDTKLSTLERYAAAIGGNFEWTVRPSEESVQTDRRRSAKLGADASASSSGR